MIAAETKLFMRASVAIFQNISPSGSRWDWRFGECLQKKTLPVVADENAIFRTGYIQCSEDGFTIFVPKDNAAIAVSESELIPEALSYKIIAYNHHSMKGNLESKRQTLLMFADLLEPKRDELETVDKKFASDLFYTFNNFNIRHNNVDPAGPKYKKPVGDLTKEQLESWYDEVYQMCLLAFMRLEHVPRKQEFDMLKDKIENKK